MDDGRILVLEATWQAEKILAKRPGELRSLIMKTIVKSADYRHGLGIFLAETSPTDAPKHIFRSLFPSAPLLFPNLRSGHRLFQGPSRQKQIPSNNSRAPWIKGAILSTFLVANLPAQLSDGIYSFNNRPDVSLASLNLIEYNASDTRASFQTRSLNLLCSRSYCSGPYVDVRAMAAVDGDLFAIDRDTSTGLLYLAKADAAYNFQRVAPASPLPNPALRALLWNGEKLIAAGQGEVLGTTVLMEISKVTGQVITGTTFPRINAVIDSFAWNPAKSALYVRTQGSPPALQRLDIATGTLAKVRDLPENMRRIAWAPPLGLIFLGERLYYLDETDGDLIPVVSGDEYFVNAADIPSLTVKGTLTLVSPLPVQLNEIEGEYGVSPLIESDGITSRFKWKSHGRSQFVMWYSPDLKFWNWSYVDDTPVSNAAGQDMQFDHTPVVPLDAGFYRLYEYPRTASLDALRLLAAVILGGLGLLIGARGKRGAAADQ